MNILTKLKSYKMY